MEDNINPCPVHFINYMGLSVKLINTLCRFYKITTQNF